MSSLTAAIGLAAVIIALAGAPLARRPRSRAPRLVAVHVGAALVILTGHLAGAHASLAALATGGLALLAVAGVIAIVRASDRGPGDSGGGGGDDGAGDPDAPGGPGVDWEEFETAFWAHVETERAARVGV